MNSRSQKVKILPKDDIASTAVAAVSLCNPSTTASVLSGSIGKSLAESTRMAGPPSLAEPAVVHPKELEATGLPFEVLAPEGATSAASLQTLPRRQNSQPHRLLYK